MRSPFRRASLLAALLLTLVVATAVPARAQEQPRPGQPGYLEAIARLLQAAVDELDERAFQVKQEIQRAQELAEGAGAAAADHEAGAAVSDTAADEDDAAEAAARQQAEELQRQVDALLREAGGRASSAAERRRLAEGLRREAANRRDERTNQEAEAERLRQEWEELQRQQAQARSDLQALQALQTVPEQLGAPAPETQTAPAGVVDTPVPQAPSALPQLTPEQIAEAAGQFPAGQLANQRVQEAAQRVEAAKRNADATHTDATRAEERRDLKQRRDTVDWKNDLKVEDADALLQQDVETATAAEQTALQQLAAEQALLDALEREREAMVQYQTLVEQALANGGEPDPATVRLATQAGQQLVTASDTVVALGGIPAGVPTGGHLPTEEEIQAREDLKTTAGSRLSELDLEIRAAKERAGRAAANVEAAKGLVATRERANQRKAKQGTSGGGKSGTRPTKEIREEYHSRPGTVNQATSGQDEVLSEEQQALEDAEAELAARQAELARLEAERAAILRWQEATARVEQLEATVGSLLSGGGPGLKEALADLTKAREELGEATTELGEQSGKSGGDGEAEESAEVAEETSEGGDNGDEKKRQNVASLEAEEIPLSNGETIVPDDGEQPPPGTVTTPELVGSGGQVDGTTPASTTGDDGEDGSEETTEEQQQTVVLDPGGKALPGNPGGSIGTLGATPDGCAGAAAASCADGNTTGQVRGQPIERREPVVLGQNQTQDGAQARVQNPPPGVPPVVITSPGTPPERGAVTTAPEVTSGVRFLTPEEVASGVITNGPPTTVIADLPALRDIGEVPEVSLLPPPVSGGGQAGSDSPVTVPVIPVPGGTGMGVDLHAGTTTEGTTAPATDWKELLDVEQRGQQLNPERCPQC
jgi:hypothetical protein